jgi:ABC-2 type transport system ATP-binding protein
VRSIIDELRADGVAVFLNSHLLGEVEATCDRVAFIKRGRIVAEHVLGTPTAALEVELRVSADAAARTAVVDGLSRFGTDIQLARPGLIALRAHDEAAIPAIVRWLVQQGVDIHAVHPRRRSLEDVFLDVMGEDERPG